MHPIIDYETTWPACLASHSPDSDGTGHDYRRGWRR